MLPHPRLRPLVRTYWQMEEFHAPGQKEHRFMPERTVCLTFVRGESWRCAPEQKTLERLPGATLTGMHLTPRRLVSAWRGWGWPWACSGLPGGAGAVAGLYTAVILMAVGEGTFGLSTALILVALGVLVMQATPEPANMPEPA